MHPCQLLCPGSSEQFFEALPRFVGPNQFHRVRVSWATMGGTVLQRRFAGQWTEAGLLLNCCCTAKLMLQVGY